MRLIFVRHAESEANAEGRLQGHVDFPLSARGRLQAESLFVHFHKKGPEPTHVYSSPLKRTAETAQIVSRRWPLKIKYSDDLKEFDIGVFSGLTWEEIFKSYPEMSSAFEKSRDWGVVEGAESFADQRARAESALCGLIKAHGIDDVVIVFTHGGFLLHLLSMLLGTEHFWSTPLMNTALFDFSLEQDKWDRRTVHYPPLGDSSFNNNTLWRINRFGDVSHLVDQVT